MKDGTDTLRPDVTAQLIRQWVEMRKQFGRKRRFGMAALVAVALLLTI